MKRTVAATLIILLGSSTALRAGDIVGKVVYSGTPPKQMRVIMSADPVCMRQNKEPVYSEEVVVNKNNTLRNVLVYVKDGLRPAKYTTPAQKATLDQNGCRYRPHVLGVQTGQEVEISNGDNTLHNVHSLSKSNPAFNAAQPNKGVNTLRKRFDAAEIFKVKCEVHPWMNAYIGVFPNPYFAVTGDDGTFSLKGLPAGEYVLETWHEKLGTQTLSVKVGTSGTAAATFTYAGR